MNQRLEISRFAEELSKTLPYIIRFSQSLAGIEPDPLTEGKITLPQYISLDLLDSDKLFKMKDIAGQLRISLPAVSGLIDRLVRLKMVKRSYDPDDRRVIYVSLTEQGKETVDKVRSARRKIITRIFSNLNSQERETYLTLIRKIKKMLYERQN